MISDAHSSPAPGTGSASSRPGLREQIAFAPTTSTASPGDAPAWLGKLDTMGNRPISSPPGQGVSPNGPPRVENPPSNAAHTFSPGRSRLPQRELRIKVWEDEDAERPDPAAPTVQHDHPATVPQREQRDEQAQYSPVGSQESVEEDSEVEDLPTTSMPSTFVSDKDGNPFSPVGRNGQAANAQPEKQDSEDADLPTRPLPANVLPNPANYEPGRPFPAQQYRQALPPQPPSRLAIDQRQHGFSSQMNPGPGQAPVVQQPVTPALPTSSPGFSQHMPPPVPAANGIVAGPSSVRPVRRRSKMRLVVVLVMLLVLAGGGVGYWIIAYQPFSVPAVTQTSLSFTNTSLGIALHYPQGWTSQLNSTHQTVAFFDANHINQVNITVTASNGSSVTSFLNKEVAQLGLTEQKSLPPLTFAGTSWQQVQGKIFVNGAKDTQTVLVSMHGNHFYSIAQIAPVTIYADADHLFFSLLRTSFQFL